MKLEIGKEYRDGFGVRFRVMGPTRENPEWVWTLQGEWFEKASGRRIGYRPVDPRRPDGAYEHFVLDS